MTRALVVSDLRYLAPFIIPPATLYRTRGGMAVVVADERGPTWLVTIGERRCWFVGPHADAMTLARQASSFRVESVDAIDDSIRSDTYDCGWCGGG